MVRRRHPLPLAVAEVTTVLWGAGVIFLVSPPWIVGYRTPGSQQPLWLLTGVVIVGLSWWSAWRYVRAQAAVAKTLAELRALSPAAVGQWGDARLPGAAPGRQRVRRHGATTAAPGATAATAVSAAPGVSALVRAAAGDRPVCPVCGAALAQRRTPHTGEEFPGCTRYPACRYAEALPLS